MTEKFFIVMIGILMFLTESVGNASIENSNFIILKSNKKNTNIDKNNFDNEQIQCLALNIYFEAANQSTAGRLAVALVTHNRVQAQQFPDTFCDVIYDSKLDFYNNPVKNKCQFSWYCDGKTDIPYNGKKWEDVKKLAKWFYKNRNKIPDITDGSTHYHGDYIKKPYWSKIYAKTVSIDNHIFYRE